ncbi:MAG TPA: hemolysin family protein [Vicinamibacteria bacterium]|nr:hemolysin family protein [Vicinamibacteria bacterium]
MIGLVLLLLFLAAASMGLAAVEAAFYLLRRRRLSHVAMQNPRAEMVNRYLEDPPTLLMPVHIGTFTAHAGMTVIVVALFLDWLSHWAMLVSFCVMLIYLLLFRLTLPYGLVRRNPERSLLVLIPFFHVYAQAMAPLVAALRKRAAPPPEEPEEATAPPVPEVPMAPVHERDEARLVDSLERFTETPVRDVMTPRPDIVAIAAAAGVRDLWRLMRETKYSRIPVYGENLDDIVGVVEIRDLIDYDGDLEEPLRPLARPVFLVPETKKIAELLKELQAQRTTFAVVIDEYGGTAGIASVEDIVEELVGEIKDEYDVEAEPIAVEGDGAVVVAGRVNLDRLEQALETTLSDSDDVGTVGGLVTTMFGRIPRAGEKVEHRGFCVEVLDAERKRVNRVRFRRVPPPPAAEA